jgi:hypothetical protein
LGYLFFLLFKYFGGKPPQAISKNDTPPENLQSPEENEKPDLGIDL